MGQEIRERRERKRREGREEEEEEGSRGSERGREGGVRVVTFPMSKCSSETSSTCNEEQMVCLI